MDTLSYNIFFYADLLIPFFLLYCYYYSSPATVAMFACFKCVNIFFIALFSILVFFVTYYLLKIPYHEFSATTRPINEF
jgi:hypothetical protein